MTQESITQDAAERRESPRYPRGDLSIEVHRTGLGGLFRSPGISVCENFSITGAQILSRDRFKLEENIVVDLTLRDLCLEELDAIVCSVADGDEPGQYRYGIRFRFNSGPHMRSTMVTHCLRNIASSLRSENEFT